MGVVHAIKWAVQRAYYITLESIAPVSDDPTVSLPAMATWSIRLGRRSSSGLTISYATHGARSVQTTDALFKHH